jgi:hypothetical protein
MTEQNKRKINEKDFLFNIDSSSCKVSPEERKDLEQKIEKLSSVFAESSQRKKLLRL